MATPKRTKDTPSAVARNDAGTAELLAAIRDIWESARLQAARSVNSALVQANWLIGRQVVEAEQRGKSRAAYSSRLLKTLSETLEKDYGNGFSVSSLQYMRAFYLGYPALLDIQHAAGVASEVQHAVRVESAEGSPEAKSHALRDLPVSATEADWQPGRLHALPESHRLVESRVEEALISRLQDFLLELGSGFAFIGRQVRLTLDGDHFYPDLVFYHAKLKCYVVIDLKVEKLTHGDLGQMQMYVNYYDREIAEPGDQPTIGLILCADKNEAMVRYVLDEKAKQIFASRYQFQLPSEDVLRAEIKREMEELDSGSAQS